MIFGLGYGELLVILLVVVLLFGSSRIPALGRSIGETIRAAKDGLSDPKEGGTPPRKPDP